MKKCVMLLICVFLLVGCQVHSSQPLSSQFHEKPLDRKVYQYHDYLLYIYENDEKQNGFTFEFELNQSGIGDFATYQDDSHQQATCILSHQKDCQLTFTFGKDYVIVKTTDEENYLSADLSGHYVLQEDLS